VKRRKGDARKKKVSESLDIERVEYLRINSSKQQQEKSSKRRGAEVGEGYLGEKRNIGKH